VMVDMLHEMASMGWEFCWGDVAQMTLAPQAESCQG
jgi:hypothetical protein